MTRRYLLFGFSLLFLACIASARDIKLRGFVTAVSSPAQFEIAEYKISTLPKSSFEVAKAKFDADAAKTFGLSDIRVGTELEIVGTYEESTREVKASHIKAFLFDTVEVSRSAWLERLPEIAKTESAHWRGTLSADGQCVVVSDSTEVSIGPNAADRAPAKSGKGTSSAKVTLAPLSALSDLRADAFVHYEGAIQPDGSVLATRVVFQQGEIEKGETGLRKKWVAKVKDPDYAKPKPGQVNFPSKKFKLLPDREAQDYISNLGKSLIPAAEQNLPSDSPLRFAFHFYLADNPTPDVNGYPDGGIVVNSGVFAALQNEAQLAFMMSNEMAGIVERTWWRNLEYHHSQIRTVRVANIVGDVASFALPLGASFGGMLGVEGISSRAAAAILNDDYGHSLQNQTDRVALEWMSSSGYDPREAPRSWEALSVKLGKDRPTGFANAYDRRRSYLLVQLQTNYASTATSNLKTDSDDFHRIAQRLQTPKKK